MGLSKIHERIPFPLAGKCKHDVRWAILLDEVRAHPVSLKARNRLDCAQDAVTQRVRAEVGGLGRFVGH